MVKPTDQQTDGAERDSNTEPSAIRKVAMLDPGFRDSQETSVLRPRILGVKVPSNPSDWRNLKFVGVSLLVAVVIFGILESKQIFEAAREAKQSAHGAAREVKQSLLDFFKK